MRLKDPLTLAGFMVVGAAVVASPYPAAGIFALGVLVVLYIRRVLWMSAIGALALVPLWALFGSKGAEDYSIRIISETMEEGDPVRQIAIILLFLVGLTFLARKPREVRRVNLMIWITIYVIMAVVSLLWSQDRLLTLRASIVAIAVVVFSLGIGCVYYGRQPQGHVHLVRAICWTSTGASMLILALAIYRGDFHVFDLTWRLGSSGHENQLSEVAAVGLLAAVGTRKQRDIWPDRVLLLFAVVIPALVVVLSKSRTTWLGLMVGILTVELCRRQSTARKLALILIMGSALGIALHVSSFERFWTRGGTSETKTLSGRTEIWDAMWPDVSKRLWLGYGFHAFWTPRTVKPAVGGWVPTAAHNGYLEMVAQLGLIGLAVVLVLIAISSRNAWRLMRHREWHEIGPYFLAVNSMALVIGTASSFIDDIQNYPMIVLLTVSIFVSHRLSILRSAAGRPSAIQI